MINLSPSCACESVPLPLHTLKLQGIRHFPTTKYSTLGRKKSLILFGLIRVLAICTYLLPAFGLTNLPVLYFVAICVQISIGMATTPLYTVMMDKSNLETAGTDYTMQNSIVYFGGIFAAAMSSILAKTIGYPGVFAISILISIIGLLLIIKIYKENTYPQIETNRQNIVN